MVSFTNNEVNFIIIVLMIIIAIASFQVFSYYGLILPFAVLGLAKFLGWMMYPF